MQQYIGILGKKNQQFWDISKGVQGEMETTEIEILYNKN